MRTSGFFAFMLLFFAAGAVQGQTYRTAPSTEAVLDGFGGSVTIAGQQVIVGQPRNQYSPGYVYVFERNDDGSWAAQQQFAAENASNDDSFGRSLATDGETLLVGGMRPDGAGGAVYVFEAENGEWMQRSMLAPEAGAEEDGFGGALAVRGDHALVGAPGLDSTGVAFLFERSDDGSWQQLARLTGSSTEAEALFGASVAFAGEELLVGAPRLGENQGTVYTYAFDEAAGEWSEQNILTGSTVDGTANFGAAITTYEGHALIGAPRVDDGVGTVFVFQQDAESGEWNETGRLLPFDATSNSRFGSSIAFDGAEALIGAPGAARFAGRLYSVQMEDGDWTGVEKLASESVQSRDFMGATLALGDGIAATGVPGDDFGAGSVVVFEKVDGAWQEANLLIGEDTGLAAVTGDQVTCYENEAGEYSCSDVDLVSFLPTREVGGERGTRINDVWGWTDAETGKEWVLLGRSDGTSFIDISDPSNPVFVAQLPMTEGSQASVWRDVKIYKDHAYVVADNAAEHGMQVVDLTQLRDIDPADMPMTIEEVALYDKINSAHNVVINEGSGYAYIVGAGGGGETCGGGLHMVDIRDPQNPTFAGCFSDEGTGRAGTGYSHDAQCIMYEGPDPDYQGAEICFGSNETALSIADVTDKENPKGIATAEYPNVAYTHQGWITDDHRYLFVNDEIDEVSGKVEETRTLIWDVTDLDDPQLVKEYTWGTNSSDHNLYIHGDYMYMSNYASGLRVHDISDPENPVEIGYFDTSPGGDNGPGYSGTWSNYPYFESGVIAVSSIGEGLFLVKKKQTSL